MKKKRGHEGGHDNEERWLLTYADLITLLLGLFVILYAMSKIDAGKYAEFVSAMEGVFGSPRGVMNVMSGSSGLLASPLPAAQVERQRLVDELSAALHTDNHNSPVSITSNERGITVHMMEQLLFASGSAELKISSIGTLDSLATVLRSLENDIRVEGHTDDVPIKTVAFASNWHLSVARAVNVGYYLIEHHGLNAERVSVVGFSEYRPLVRNDSPEHRARNRRVDIVILTGGGAAMGSTRTGADSLKEGKP